MKLQRLLEMDRAEIFTRGMQKASKSIDRLAMTTFDARHQLPDLFDQLMADPQMDGLDNGDIEKSGISLQKQFNLAVPGIFFEGAVDGRMPTLFGNCFPEAREQIIAAADAVGQGQFDILGYGKMNFGNPVKWNLDPLASCQAPPVHWSRIDPLDYSKVGDHKVIWELNRHQWLVDLGQAYQFTGDENYAEIFAAYLREWMAVNPPGLGINWASSLEVSLRMMCWSWALVMFRNSRALGPALFTGMMAWIGAHASYIEKYLSYYYSPNTHLTGEALGLYYAGHIFPRFRAASRWRKLGKRILEEQIERQVYVDGVYFEQSTRYQHYTVEIYLHFLILAAKNNEPVLPVVTDRVGQMLDFLLRVRSPDGTSPQIGDADGGNLLQFLRRRPDDYRALFSTAAVLFKRGDYAWAAGGLAPETLWLTGQSGADMYASLLPAPPESTLGQLYPYGGYTVMRSGWGEEAHQLIFDAGPLGCPYSSGHGHADLLSIQCSVFGQPCLVDAGTYCYTRDQTWRNYFRSTAAHNTVVVDGTGQAIPAGAFSWNSKVKARLRRRITTDDCVLVDADHMAYHGLVDPVTHRRRILFVKSRFWVVVDDLDGHAGHQLELGWQFAPLDVAMDKQGWVNAAGRNGRGLRVRSFSAAPLTATIYKGSLDPIRGWISPDYGQRVAAPQLVYSTTGYLPVRIVTLLVPDNNVSAHSPTVTQQMIGRHMKLDIAPWKQTVYINDHDILISQSPENPGQENEIIRPATAVVRSLPTMITHT